MDFPRALPALLSLFLLVPLSSDAANQSKSCSLPGTDKQEYDYCKSVPLGSTNRFDKLSYFVRLKSDFFDGLKRVSTTKGFEFSKGSLLLRNYPERFIIEVEAPVQGLLVTSRSAPRQVLRPSPDEIPRKIVLRWRDASGRVLGEQSLALEELVEPWTELSPARVWYRTSATRVHQPLSAQLEVIVFTRAKAPAGSIRTCSLGLCPQH